MRTNPIAAVRCALPHVWHHTTPRCYFHQVHAPRVLRETVRSAEVLGMSPFLAFGTLLGWRREGRVILWDDDLDLGILEEDTDEVDRLVGTMEALGYRIRDRSDLELSFKHSPSGGSIDIFVYRRRARTGQVYSGVYFRGPDRRVEAVSVRTYPDEVFGTLRTVRFLGVDVKVPGQTDRYLDLCYGVDWRIPVKRRVSQEEKKRTMYPNKTIVSLEAFRSGRF